MVRVEFYGLGDIDDGALDYAVIVTRYKDSLVLCKHRLRDTWEIPGGRREKNESIERTAERELFEETGALRFDLRQICIYAVASEMKKSYGLLCFADVKELGVMPESEIERIDFFDKLPDNLTYAAIQPLLLDRVAAVIGFADKNEDKFTGCSIFIKSFEFKRR